MKSHLIGESPEKELIKTIHGHSGYQTAENRGPSDERLRKYLSNKIRDVEQAFQCISEKISLTGDKEMVITIDKLIRQLKILTETLNKPTYKKSPFFINSNFNTDILSQLYEYESQIEHHLFILDDEVSEFCKIEEITEPNEFLNHLFDVIDNVNQIIMEREFLLTGGYAEAF